jgi:hypothetical protein
MVVPLVIPQEYWKLPVAAEPNTCNQKVDEDTFFGEL